MGWWWWDGWDRWDGWVGGMSGVGGIGGIGGMGVDKEHGGIEIGVHGLCGKSGRRSWRIIWSVGCGAVSCGVCW